jgi:coenzyme F420-reducing hydrogenase delta subunit
MLTILYPEGDYTSADIAIRTQALAQGQSVYVVPKHYGRNEETVFKKLQKSKDVLFIAYDKMTLDAHTTQEIQFLLEKGKTIHAIIPDALLGMSPRAKIYTFSKTNKSDFAQAIQTFMNSVKPLHPAITSKQSKDDAFLALIGVLLLSILFLSLVNLQEEHGKK